MQKRKTVLQYLSTTSDSFLIIAFASLLALPLAIGVAIQPVKKENTNQVLASARAIQYNNSETHVAPTVAPVLGVSDYIPTSPLQNVETKFALSPDTKKLVFTQGSNTSSEYSIGGNVKAAGTYDLLALTNKNAFSLNYELSLTSTDKVYSITVNVGEKPYVMSNTSNKPVSFVLNGNSSINVSLTAKQANSFKVTVKVL